MERASCFEPHFLYTQLESGSRDLGMKDPQIHGFQSSDDQFLFTENSGVTRDGTFDACGFTKLALKHF